MIRARRARAARPPAVGRCGSEGRPSRGREPSATDARRCKPPPATPSTRPPDHRLVAAPDASRVGRTGPVPAVGRR